MDYLFNILQLLFIALEISAFAKIATYKNEKRVSYKTKSLIAFSCALVFIVGYAFIITFTNENYAPYFFFLFDLIFFLFYFIYFRLVFSLSNRAIYFVLTLIALGRYLTLVPSNMIIDVLLITGDFVLPQFISILVELPMSIIILYILFHIFAKRYSGKQEEYANKHFISFFYVLVFINVIDNALQYSLRYTAYTYLLLLAMTQFFFLLMMIFIFYSMLREGQSDMELMIVKRLWKEDKKHYELQKESIDIINIKCHDLRHQIQDYRQQGTVTDKMMHQLEDSIHIYDSVIKTGNEALDVILSSFSLRCQNKNIELTTMADGRGLFFVDEVDMYSLFTNLLDNAFEYEESIPEESRFISLTIKSFNQFIHIHIENAYLGETNLDPIELKTSKKDQLNHGFGIKSMKNIVSKYDGQFDILIADEMFQVDILLPERKGVKHD